MNTVPDTSHIGNFNPNSGDDFDPDKIFPMIDKIGIQVVEITPVVPAHAARIAKEDQRELDDAMEFYDNVKKGETDG